MSLPRRVLNRLFYRREPVQVQFLTRPGCRLCEDAEPRVRIAFGEANVERLNILEHPALEEQYVFRIPVIVYAGNVMAEGALNRFDLRQARRRVHRMRREGRPVT